MTTVTALPRKEIVYDRETRDYAIYLNGELVGFARTYHEAEITLDQLVFELISGHFGVQPDPVPVKPIHVTTYTVVLSEPSETYTYAVRHPSSACTSKTTNRSAQGEVINGYCDGCGIGPSMPHHHFQALGRIDKRLSSLSPLSRPGAGQ